MAITIAGVQALPGGWLLTVDGLHPNEPTGHHVWIPTEAVADRCAVYGLPSTGVGRRRAVAYILREHRQRLAAEDIDPTTISVTGTW